MRRRVTFDERYRSPTQASSLTRLTGIIGSPVSLVKESSCVMQRSTPCGLATGRSVPRDAERSEVENSFVALGVLCLRMTCSMFACP